MKNNEIIINEWQKGIALSPYQGFGDMRNVDVSLWPGVVKIALAAAKKSGTTITGLPMWAVQDIDASATIYVLDNLQRLYKSDSTSQYGTWTLITHASPSTGQGNGLALWHKYVFIAGDSAIDVYNISTPGWTDAWKTLLTDTSTHPFLSSTNDVLYVADGPDATNILGPTLNSIKQVTGKIFTPGDATTFTYTANAVGATLLYGYRIRCLVQMGNNIYIGTFFGNANGDQKVADIFPWDRVSSSFGVPIRKKEFGVNQMIADNNVIYFQAGTIGNFYVTNGSLTQLLFTFPRSTIAEGNLYRNTTTYPGAIILNKGRIFFGVTMGSGSNGETGVYSVNTDGSGLVMENTISEGTTNNFVAIGCLHPTLSSNMEYLIGWKNSAGATQGVDTVGEDNYVTSYGAYIDTPVYVIGTVLSPNSLQQLEIYLDRPLLANEGIRISYRVSLAASFTTLITFDNSTYTAAQKYNFAIGPYLSGEMAQFRISLTGTTTSPTLRYARLV